MYLLSFGRDDSERFELASVEEFGIPYQSGDSKARLWSGGEGFPLAGRNPG